MNIAEIKQLQAVGGWIDFQGQITKVGDLKARTKANKNMQKLRISDQTDEIGIWAYAEFQFLPNQRIKGRGQVKEYEGHRYIDYAKVQVDGQTAPQQPPQAPQAAPQSTNQHKPDWDAIAEGKVRHGLVCAYIQSGLNFCLEDLEKWKTYIMTGHHPDNVPRPDESITEQPEYQDEPPPDDPPF